MRPNQHLHHITDLAPPAPARRTSMVRTWANRFQVLPGDEEAEFWLKLAISPLRGGFNDPWSNDPAYFRWCGGIYAVFYCCYSL